MEYRISQTIFFLDFLVIIKIIFSLQMIWKKLNVAIIIYSIIIQNNIFEKC